MGEQGVTRMAEEQREGVPDLIFLVWSGIISLSEVLCTLSTYNYY